MNANGYVERREDGEWYSTRPLAAVVARNKVGAMTATMHQRNRLPSAYIGRWNAEHDRVEWRGMAAGESVKAEMKAADAEQPIPAGVCLRLPCEPVDEQWLFV